MGEPAQFRCRYEACTFPVTKPSGPSAFHCQAGVGPAAGEAVVRWNSCPRTRVPAGASTLSVSATADR